MMSDNHDMIGLNIAHAYLYFLVGSQPADLTQPSPPLRESLLPPLQPPGGSLA